jgi:hypothetical protein
MNDTLMILLIISGIIIGGVVALLFVNEAKGQVFLEEDQVLLCLSAVWTDTANDISCKVYQQDDIDKMDMHEIYADIMMERDTFDISR